MAKVRDSATLNAFSDELEKIAFNLPDSSGVKNLLTPGHGAAIGAALGLAGSGLREMRLRALEEGTKSPEELALIRKKRRMHALGTVGASALLGHSLQKGIGHLGGLASGTASNLHDAIKNTVSSDYGDVMSRVGSDAATAKKEVLDATEKLKDQAIHLNTGVLHRLVRRAPEAGKSFFSTIMDAPDRVEDMIARGMSRGQK